MIDGFNLEYLLLKGGSELYGETLFAPLLLSGLMVPEYSFFDSLNIAKGSSFSSTHMRYDLPHDLLTNEWQFNIPVALIMGRHDIVTPTGLAREYFDRTDALLKAWYELEESARFPHFEQPDQFIAVLSELRNSWGEYPQVAGDGY